MTSIKITRRQFLKWISASAAVLGLSQTDLLKIEQALAAGPTPDPTMPLGTLARVIWIAGAACSGCPTSLLNYIGDPNDADPVLRAIAQGAVTPVDDIETLYPLGGDKHVDIAEVVLEIITIDYAQIIMAASGDVPNLYMKDLRDAGGYVLLVEGTIQTADNGKYCRIFDMPGDLSGGIWDPYIKVYTETDDFGSQTRTEFTMAGATLWLAENAVATIALGTCAAFGGVPAAKGSVTGGKSAWEWIVQENGMTEMTVVNVPGCPPHPDWFIQTVGAFLLGVLDLDTSLDHKGRPKNTSKAVFHDDASYVFCEDCPRRTKGYAQTLGEAGRSSAKPKGMCLLDVGCMGNLAGPDNIRADCPTRMWNPIEKYVPGLKLKKNNWCVGNNYPCQGCTDPGFPDTTSPFFSKVKGY